MLGRKGSGKTTQLCRLLSQHKYGDRAVLIDPPGNIDFGITVEDLHSMEVLMERQSNKKFRIRYSAIEAIDFGADHDFNFLKLEAIMQLCFDVGDCTLVIDEVDMFCNPYGIPPTFKRLLSRGRHDSINLIWTARRPQEVNKLLLSQSDEFFLFQMHHPADVDYFRAFMSFDRDQVLTLQVGQSLHWTAGEAQSTVTSPDA
jgi:hypothetical protein